MWLYVEGYSGAVLDKMWTCDLGKLFREYFYNEKQLYYLLTTTPLETAGHDIETDLIL